MHRTRSALGLILLGVMCAAFFWVTDPTIGPAMRLMDSSVNRIDAMNQAKLGTVLGLAGTVLAVIVGLWSIWRRPA